MKKQYEAPQAKTISFCQNESIADVDIGGGNASFGGGGLPDFNDPNDPDNGYQIGP